MLDDLTPQGPMQLVFAERIIDLAWRLKRLTSIQNQAIDEMIKEKRMNTYYRIIDGGFDDKRNTDDLLVGQAVIRDFRTSQVLERLMKYEQQIEKSLYKNIQELKALQKENQYALRKTHHEKKTNPIREYQESRIEHRVHKTKPIPNPERRNKYQQSRIENRVHKTNPIPPSHPLIYPFTHQLLRKTNPILRTKEMNQKIRQKRLNKIINLCPRYHQKSIIN